VTPPETALASAARYDALLGYASDLLALLDAAGLIRYASPSHESLLGAAPATLLGTPFLERLHADDRAAVQAALAAVLARPETPRRVTYRYQQADGSWPTVAATLSNRLDDPLLAGIVVAGRDVTAQREAQAAADATAMRLRVLQEVTDTVLAHLGLDDLMRQVLERVTAALGVDNTAILLLDEDGQDLRLHLAHGPEEALAGRVRVPRGQGVAGRILATQEPLIVDDMAEADPVNPFLREHIRSLLGVPLRVNSRAIGVLHVGTLAPHRFGAQDLHWLQLVADRVALALDHARLFAAERAAREQATRQAHELEAIFEAIGDAVIVYDAEGHVLRANAAAHALIRPLGQPGYGALPVAERAALARPRDEAGRPVAPDAVPAARVLRGERFIGAAAVDVLTQMPEGREVLLNVTGAPMRDVGGQIVGGVTVSRDVAERRQLERRTHDALDALLAMARTLVQPPDGHAEEAGAGALRGVGRRLVELTRDVLGCTRVGLVAFDSQQGVQRPLAVAGLSAELERLWWDSVDGAPASDPQAPTDPELVTRFLAGEVVLLDMTRPPFDTLPNPFGIRTALFAPLRLAGDVGGVLSLDHGGAEHTYTPEEMALAGAVAQLAALVLERERLLRERAEAQAGELALREVNRRMDEFLAIAAHELRGPLTSIRGNLQLLQRRLWRPLTAEGAPAASAEGHDLLQRTIEQTGRLTRMMTDLLDVSRIESGHLALHPEPCDLADPVRRCVEEARLAWPARAITLEMPAGAVRVQADAGRLEQVVANYLTNALKYSPPDQPVGVSLHMEGDTVRVQVRDQGPGLTAEQQREIWERYRRVPGVAVQDEAPLAGGGLGLGLYISRTIIVGHGGAVGVESAPGTGSTFSFMLPLA
jgi:PAS domain S-box-containing protein